MLTGAQTVEIASELEFKDAFPDCETGAMPPYVNLHLFIADLRLKMRVRTRALLI